MEKVSFEDLKVGEVYSVEQIQYYNENIDEPWSILAKVLSKKDIHKPLKLEIIREYNNVSAPTKYPSNTIDIFYGDFTFLKPYPAQIANAKRKQTLDEFKQKMVELRGLKKLPNNIAAQTASYITGVSGKTLKEQEANLQAHIKFLEKRFRFTRPPEPKLNGGRIKTRKRHLKSRFKSSKRKTT